MNPKGGKKSSVNNQAELMQLIAWHYSGEPKHWRQGAEEKTC